MLHSDDTMEKRLQSSVGAPPDTRYAQATSRTKCGLKGPVSGTLGTNWYRVCGAASIAKVEILDGLAAGDQIVISGLTGKSLQPQVRNHQIAIYRDIALP